MNYQGSYPNCKSRFELNMFSPDDDRPESITLAHADSPSFGYESLSGDRIKEKVQSWSPLCEKQLVTMNEV